MTIKAGDMVIFVRACCSSGDPYLGMVFQVERMQGNFLGVWCSGCNTQHTGITFARFKLSPDSPWTAWIPPHWLKKIEPVADAEPVKHGERIAA